MNQQEYIPDLTVVILAYNEEIHLRRAIESAWQIASQVIIVDSYSADATVSIANEMKASVIQNPFVNQAQQFQWAMETARIKTGWTMRMDADEYLTPELVQEIKNKLNSLGNDISGVVLKRQLHFMGQWIRHGGNYPIHLLRIWRTGHAVIEQRWMDEHVVLKEGTKVIFENDFIDENLNSLSWWTSKHNDYSTREAIDILNRKYQLMNSKNQDDALSEKQYVNRKRWYKDNLYLRAPMFIRCFLYFLFRFWLRFGFLDGKKGLVWHFLQGFWYRFLVDAKILQIEWMAKKENKTITTIIIEKYKVNLDSLLK